MPADPVKSQHMAAAPPAEEKSHNMQVLEGYGVYSSSFSLVGLLTVVPTETT